MTATYDRLETTTIANTIRAQIGINVLMSLGATDLAAETDPAAGRPGFTCTVRILPMRKDGTRGTRPRRMKLSVWLDPTDTYTVTVLYDQGRATRAHFIRSGVYADELAGLVLALDYDGNETLNPRIAA